MPNIVRSAFDFTKGVGLAVLAIGAAITDPLAVAQMFGLVGRDTHWAIGASAMRLLFLAIGVGLAFNWYHGVRKQMEQGIREPDMPLHQACRWIARDSVWAAKYHWKDEDWPLRVAAEFFSKWHLGRFEMMGHQKPNGPIEYLPPAMKQASSFDVHKLCGPEPPFVVWSEGDGPTRYFYDVRLDKREVHRTWPKRSVLDKLRRKSPVERTGDYGEIFRQQDAWHAKTYG